MVLHLNKGYSSTSRFGSLLIFLKILLSFAELGQVQGGNFLCLLNLLLVGLDLLLKLAGQFRHAVLILAVFISLELEFLDMALSLLEGLVCFSSLGLDGSKFNLELTNASLKLSHGITSTLGSNFIGLSQPQLNLSNLGLKSTLSFALGRGMILFSSEFISKTGSINHGPLGLLLRCLGLGKCFINFSMDGMNSRL